MRITPIENVRAELKNYVKTREEAYHLAEIISSPLEIAERAGDLLEVFISRYIIGENQNMDLSIEAKNNPRIISTLIYQTFELVSDVQEMLSECYDFIQEEEKTS